MKRILILFIGVLPFMVLAQSTPTSVNRGAANLTQVDQYLTAVKRLGIPTGATLSLDATTSAQNSAKMFYRTTDSTLHVYNPVSDGWIQVAKAGDSGGGGSVELGSGLYKGSDDKINIGLDLATLGTTDEGILTEALYLLKQSNDNILTYLNIDDGVINNVLEADDGNKVASLIMAMDKNAIPSIVLSKRTPTGDQSIEFTNNRMTILDGIGQKGFEYVDDYSDNYTNRSLVDKEYVDNNSILILDGTSVWDRRTEPVGSNFGIFIGADAGAEATDVQGSNFFGYKAGEGAEGSSTSNFFGAGAGLQAIEAINSNFFGASAGGRSNYASSSNFFGASAGAGTEAFNSNFFGYEAGYEATNANNSNFFGHGAGYEATNAINSNFFGTGAGRGATNAINSNFFGPNVGSSFSGNNLGPNNIIIGTNISLPDSTSNAINIGGIIFGAGTQANASGNPRIVPQTEGKIGIGVVTPTSTLDVNGDIESVNVGSGFILKSPNGSRWRITVDNSGNLSATSL